MPSYLEQAQDTASKILSKLEEVDFKGLMDSAKNAVDGVSRLVNSPSIQSSLKSLERTMPKIDEAVVGDSQNDDQPRRQYHRALGKSPADFRRGSRRDATSWLDDEADRCGAQRSRGGDDKHSRYQRSGFCRLSTSSSRSLREVSAPRAFPASLSQFMWNEIPGLSSSVSRSCGRDNEAIDQGSITKLRLIALSLAGCGTFSPRPDPSRFFTLSSLPQVEQVR